MREVIAERELTESLNTPLSPTAAMQPQTDDMYAIQATVGTRTRSYLKRTRKKEEKGKDEKTIAKERDYVRASELVKFELPCEYASWSRPHLLSGLRNRSGCNVWLW